MDNIRISLYHKQLMSLKELLYTFRLEIEIIQNNKILNLCLIYFFQMLILYLLIIRMIQIIKILILQHLIKVKEDLSQHGYFFQ